MKSYEEMAASVLARSRVEIEQKKKRRMRVVWTAVPVCFVLALSLILGWIVHPWQSQDLTNTAYMVSPDIYYQAGIGETFKSLEGSELSFDSAAQGPSPGPAFAFDSYSVLAQAVEEVGEYTTLGQYGAIVAPQTFRVYRMKVLDPLDTDIGEEFYYAVQGYLGGDLTEYEMFAINLWGRFSKHAVFQGQEGLRAFETLYYSGPYLDSSAGSVLPFTDGVFDESIWQEAGWQSSYRFLERFLDPDSEWYPVNNSEHEIAMWHGITLEEVLQNRKGEPVSLRHPEYTSPEAVEAERWITPFVNGVYAPARYGSKYHRMINGCPTNEWIELYYHRYPNGETVENVTRSEVTFSEQDMASLPNLSRYIEALDLSALQPQHTDPTGKTLKYCVATGFYEKTAKGIYSVVRIAWRHLDEDYREYYDETFILLEENGPRLVSREQLIDRIGRNVNISYDEYGVGYTILY